MISGGARMKEFFLASSPAHEAVPQGMNTGLEPRIRI